MDRNRDVLFAAGLLGLCCLVQVVLIRRATVPALDAVGFVEIARRIDDVGMLATIRSEREQPLFAAWVWLVHKGVKHVAGDFRSSWALSAQLAAAIPLVLVVVPVYLVSVRLVGRTAALAGCLLFCVLPEVSRLGADGISDSTHLFWFCLTFWAMTIYLTECGGQAERVQGLGFRVQGSGFRVQGSAFKVQSSGLGDQRSEVRGEDSGAATLEAAGRRDSRVAEVAFGDRSTRSAAGGPAELAPARNMAAAYARPSVSAGRGPGWLLAAGLFSALAVLTRAEAVLLPAAFVVALAAMQLRARWRQPWSRLAGHLACLGLGCGLVLGPYLVAVGATAPGPALARILGRHEPGEEESSPPGLAGGTPSAAAWRMAGDEPMSFAPKETATSLRRRGGLAAAGQFGKELAKAFGYLAGAFALLGVWRLRGVLRRRVDRFAQVYLLLFSLAVLGFTAREGYLSARHLVTLVVLGIGCAGYGALELGRRAADRRRAPGPGVGRAGQRQRALSRPAVAWSAVLLAMAACLWEALEPLHASRLGHRQAAEWLARQTDTPGIVLDTRGWTGLYSGRRTCRYDQARKAFSHPHLAFVVLEQRELEYASRRSRTLRHLLGVAAEPVAGFPQSEAARRGRHIVVVYRWNPERLSQWVAGQSHVQANAEEHLAKEDPHARTRPRVHPERG